MSQIKPSVVVNKIPDYRSTLHALTGEGRAIVSEPGNTERVTIIFMSNRSKSLVKIRNGIGIKGGELLTDGDTLTVYNKIDKYVRKIAVRSGNLQRINKLASLNILQLINYPFTPDEVSDVFENESLYKLALSSGTLIYIDKKSYNIRQIEQPNNTTLPYSKIQYDAYGTVGRFTLPRRISIFGAEKKSKIALQLTSLDLNPDLGNLHINYPDDIPVYHR
ncbi:DUF4292 domain-containing protein [Fodinibius saliphilus]|uniref:DUF4292 domain-containing protein n=1 Tax=Fodinibius saliphilus TaxID=1920650 RepID=UPI0014874631|nr:DUF4292 domain-containing protein [Fodinibius saliphilus]